GRDEEVVQVPALRRQQGRIDGAIGGHAADVVGHEPLQERRAVVAADGDEAALLGKEVERLLHDADDISTLALPHKRHKAGQRTARWPNRTISSSAGVPRRRRTASPRRTSRFAPDALSRSALSPAAPPRR